MIPCKWVWLQMHLESTLVVKFYFATHIWFDLWVNNLWEVMWASPYVSYLPLLLLRLYISILKSRTGNPSSVGDILAFTFRYKYGLPPPKCVCVLNMTWGVFTLVFRAALLDHWGCVLMPSVNRDIELVISLCSWLKTQRVYCGIIFTSVDGLQLFWYVSIRLLNIICVLSCCLESVCL